MRSFSRIGLSAALVALTGVLGACGSGSGTVAPTSVRVVNATASSTLTLSLNGAPAVAGITPGTASGYASENPGTYAAAVTDTANVLNSGTLTANLGTGESYTIVAYGRAGTLYAGVLTDNLGIPSSGQTALAFANFSPDSGPLDIYVLSSTTYSTLSAYQSAVTGGSITASSTPYSWQNVMSGTETASTVENAGTVTIVATAHGNPSDVRFFNASVTLTGGQAEVLVFTGTSGGGLVNGSLLVQGASTISSMAMNYARVRTVSALNNTTGSTDATVAGMPVTNNGLPVGAYTLVPASSGGTVTAMTAAGTAVTALPSGTVSAGNDYTLVAYGASSAPLALLLQDSNLYAYGGSLIRVVNVTASGTTVALSVNGSPVVGGVAYASASAYTGVTNTGASPAVSLYSSGASNVAATVPGGSLIPGDVYTVFVYNTALSSIMSEDR